MDLNKLLGNMLIDTGKKILHNDCELPVEQQVELIKLIGHQPMSKQESCWFLDIHRSKFDQLVRDGILPQGRKRPGFKELTWYKDELEIFKDKITNVK